MKTPRAIIASGIVLGILMFIAYALGKSLETFLSPIIVWLLLATHAFRKAGRRSCNCSTKY